MIHFEYEIPDYEHNGDYEYERIEVLKICSEATNFYLRTERNYEAENEIEDEYGEIDEPIYLGYIGFDAPESYSDQLDSYFL